MNKLLGVLLVIVLIYSVLMIPLICFFTEYSVYILLVYIQMIIILGVVYIIKILREN